MRNNCGCKKTKGLFPVAVLAIMLLAIPANAQIWGSDIRLTIDPNESYTASQSIAVSADTVHVVWADDRDGSQFKLFYKQSTDNANSWDDDALIADVAGVDFPAVAVAGSNVHVVWSDDHYGNTEISYIRSADNGTTWGTDVRMTSDDSSSAEPRIAVNDINVHLIWSDTRDTNPEIYYKRSTNNGTNWDVDRRGTVSDSQCVQPAIAVSGDTIHIVWTDDRDGNPEIYYTRSTNNGETWGGDVRLTTNDSTSSFPAIAVIGSILHVAWEDKRDGELELYYKRSINNGATWGLDTRLTDDEFITAGNLEPSIAAAGEDVHIVWNDFLDGNPEIYYIRSIDNGSAWEDQIRLTDDTDDSYSPSIAAWNYDIHVLWTDERSGNPEVYYKHGLSGDLQPDNHIKNDYETIYIGDGIYNDNGTNQVEEQPVRPGDTAIYHIRIENDGDIPEEIMVGGTVGITGWTVIYYDSLVGGTDITSLIEYYIWSTGELEPDSFVEIRVEVIPDLTIPEDSSFGILVISSSTYDVTRIDAVQALTTATENPGVDEDFPTPVDYSLTIQPGSRPVIEFSLSTTEKVCLTIADISGRVVKTLTARETLAGYHQVSWDALDDYGVRMPTGVYFCQLRTANRTLARKFILVQ